ncbi:MAG: hypothetical protein GF315_03120 [candidate division Zixibacteria bacterium]|nr:hypothetical protein [candidate division Zixibacteria bacterium]
MRRISVSIFIVIVSFSLIQPSCGEKPERPTASGGGETELGDTLYIPLSPAWDAGNGFDFSSPQDVLVGLDTYIYVADTGNDRIVRLDAGGTIHAVYNGIPHPTQISQDELMRLIVVNDTRDVYKIDVGPNGDRVPIICYDASTRKDSAFVDASEVFTGVADYPSIDKAYLLSVSSELTSSGKVIMMQGKGMGDFQDQIMDSIIVSYDESDTLHNPIVEYGLGAGFAAHPNALFSFVDEESVYLLMTQDSSTFKTQLLTIKKVQGGTYNFVSALDPTSNPDIYGLNLFGLPEDACADIPGNIYVVDSSPSADYGAYKFNASGELMESFGPPGSDADQLSNPMGIAYDDNGDRRIVYIADTGNNRIVRYRLNTDLE